MLVLNRKNLAAGKLNVGASGASSRKPVGILQIGDGNFLRAFADWLIDVANGAGLMNGEVTIAQPLAVSPTCSTSRTASTRCCCAACRTAKRSSRSAS